MTTDIAKDQLTGAHIDLKLVLDAVEEGIKMYPIAGCQDIHEYIQKMPRNTMIKVLTMIQNLGVESNAQFRAESLGARGRNETKDSLVVCVVEAFSPKRNDLPVSI